MGELDTGEVGRDGQVMGLVGKEYCRAGTWILRQNLDSVGGGAPFISMKVAQCRMKPKKVQLPRFKITWIKF